MLWLTLRTLPEVGVLLRASVDLLNLPSECCFFFTSAFPFYGKILTFVDYVIVTKHFSNFSRLEGTLGIEFAPLWFPSVLEIAVLGPQRLWWGSVKFGQDFGRLSLSLTLCSIYYCICVFSVGRIPGCGFLHVWGREVWDREGQTTYEKYALHTKSVKRPRC